MAKPPEQVVIEEIDKQMDNFIDRVFQLSQENLVNDGKIDTGTLFKTANVKRKFLEKEIIYPASYAEAVEFGRDAGSMPPPQALYKWVRRKLGIKNEVQIRRTAFAIAKAIEKRGIEPSMFLRRAIDKARGEFDL